MIWKLGRPVKDLESLNKHDVSHTISIDFLSLIPWARDVRTCWDINSGHFDDTSRFTSDDALRRWQPPFGWPHASSSLVEGRGIPKTARDLLYHKTVREWRVHPIMKLETYILLQFGKSEPSIFHQHATRAREPHCDPGNLLPCTGPKDWRGAVAKVNRFVDWATNNDPREPFAKRKDKTKRLSLPAIATAFILILICRLIFDFICFAFGFVVPNVDLRSHSSSQLVLPWSHRWIPTCQVSVAFWQHCVIQLACPNRWMSHHTH